MAQEITTQDLEEVKTVAIMHTDFNVYGTTENPLFLASDVAEMIEYSSDKVGQMLELVDDDEKLTDTIYRAGQRREMWFLTENGLYELLMQSRKPLAKRFKAEIKKVLQQIRRGELLAQRAALRDNMVILENTQFIFETNFSGDPKRDRFNSDQRRGNIIIPSEERALELRDLGINVKETKPKPDDEFFTPTYFVSIKLNYESKMPPKLYLINESGATVLLDSESANIIDDMWVNHVNAVLNIYDGPNGKSLYIKSMEIFQQTDNDPIADRHR